ncbi:MAG: hypothetical protein ACXADH_10690 [Candidatus Kariarchaeaceae archaeon]|jgi:hypothetical protein
MNNILRRINDTETISRKSAFIIAVIFAVLISLRDAIIVWGFSFGYYGDSNLYVSLGRTLFQKSGSFSAGIVSLPYPFLNTITSSASNPLNLVWLQILIGAFAAGALIYVVARKNPILSVVIGILFLFDFVWGAVNRNILTEGLYVSFHVLSLALLISHYDRRETVTSWELLAAGVFYGWAFIFRPSSLFLTLLIVPLYFWLTRSWRKTGFYMVMGLFNLWSSGEFRIMSQSGYYTASPLFVYRLFSPDNGPASQEIDQAFSECFPDLDYANAMETTAGGDKNNDILYRMFLPCLNESGLNLDQISDLYTQAYMEGIIKRPIYYGSVLMREGLTVIKYNAPLILRLYLKPEFNNRCEDYAWCENIRESRMSWTNKLLVVPIYERVATKFMQLYLLPLRPLNLIFRNDKYLPIATAFILVMGFLLIATRGRVRFLVVITLLFLLYIILSIISGYGFLPRYASVLTPYYSILSATAIVTIGNLLVNWLFRDRELSRSES